MPNTFTLAGNLKSAVGNSAREGEYVYIRLKSFGTDTEDDVTYVNDNWSVGPSDANGDLPTETLWINGDSGVSSVYEIRFENGATAEVVIPSSVEGKTVNLEDILQLYQTDSSTQQSTVLSQAIDRTNHTGGPDDLNGNKIILDVDGDTSITADTDDTIDFEIGGADVLALTASRAAALEDLGTVGAPASDGQVLVATGAGAWALESGSTLRASIGTTLQNAIFVAKNGTDTRTGLDPHDIGNPFLTVTAAQTAASSGDTIVVFPGDYSGETALAGKDGVYYYGLDGATLPAFNVTTAITVKGRGLAQSLTCSNVSAVMDMPEMDAGTFIFCSGGTQTAGNAGTYILCDDGTQTAGNAGTFIQCSGGTQTAGNAGTYIRCTSGMQILRNGRQSHDGTTFAPISLSSTGSLYLYNYRSESTESGGVVVDIANSWSGSLFASDCELTATTVATNEATKGINYGTGVTGDVQLKNCTIITAENGTGTAKSIDAPAAQTVYIQGSLNQTHDEDSDITFAGGSAITNTNFTA